MKIRLLLTTLILALFTAHTWAGAGYCSYLRNAKGAAAKTTTADLAEDYYDIKYLNFNLNMSDTSVYVSGDVSTTAKVVVASMTNYVFELDTTMNIDSAKVNGVLYPVTNVGWVRTITLSAPLLSGAMFTAQIWYHGLPPGAGASFFNGITHAVTPGGTHTVFTVSDPYVAKNWWPSKQSILDKVDSVDMFISVPSGVVDGSNGKLVQVDSTSNPGYWKYHWKTNYAIDYYLISVAIARYSEYKHYWHFPASTDSMLIQNFFMDTATFNPAFKAGFDSLGLYIDYFSSLYGRYPFWREKYGVCYTTLPGGMENQTMTTIGVPNTYIIAHELCHQWFGDNVTYRNWGDVWLSEAFATFSEQLFLSHFWSPAAGKAHRQGLNASALSSPCGMLYVNDTTNSDSLFNQRTVYNKGQAVVRMLQYIAPSDSAFFQVLRTYHQNFALGHAITSDLKSLAETVYGINLDTFFNQWIYGRGFPKYKISWNQSGSTVFVKLIQSASCPSYTPHFSTPLQIQLHSATADTFIKVYNSLDTQIYSFTWSPTMTNVYLNPDVWTLLQLLSAPTHDPSLSTGSIINSRDYKIFPNPTKSYWQIDGLGEGTSLALSDISGKLLWQGSSSGNTTVIPGQKLPSGNYFLKMGEGKSAESVKLEHW